MSFILEAPFPNLQVSTILPSPSFSNQENLLHDINVKRATDGTRRTYVVNKDRKRLLWTFNLDRPKALELRAFFTRYFVTQIRITDHEGEVWVGNLTNNPFEFDTSRRAAGGSFNSIVGVRQEKQTVTIQFEGKLQ